jgi:phenylalanyl-tRNA synthetase beta chain
MGGFGAACNPLIFAAQSTIHTMKISYNWLRDYLDFDFTPEQLAEILTSTGLEVEGWETYESIKGGLKGIVVGEVIEHTKLDQPGKTISLNQVNVGREQPLQIICGASNVDKGQKVWVAVPGTSLYPNNAEEPFVIGERKTYGHLSQGMICAEDELNLGTSHAGIMVLPSEMQVGITATDHYAITNDTIIEIGLTPNRADATNHLGVALDIAAWMRVHQGKSAEIKRPTLPDLTIGNVSNGINVEVQNLAACPRFCGVVITDLQVKESPEWLKQRLLSVGQRPINNVVDITNFVRIEMGQPLHAYDLNAVSQAKVVVRNLPKATKFKTLDGNEVELLDTDLMVCNGNQEPMCMAGVFGGADSGVHDATTAIFLEAAHFDAKTIRRSMVYHGLRTDAAWTFEKGADPNAPMRALARAVQLLQDIAFGKCAPTAIDTTPNPAPRGEVAVQYSRINRLIGMEFTPQQVHTIMDALEIEMTNKTDIGFTALIPTNKPEVTREADVIEEILRIHGLNNVPEPSQMRTSMEIIPKPDASAAYTRAANFLAANGYLECMSLSLSNPNYYTEVLGLQPDTLVTVHNTANQGLDTMRADMLSSALENVRRNVNRQRPDLRLFEFGKVYSRNEDKIIEAQKLSIIATGAFGPETWHAVAKKEADYYTVRGIADQVLAQFAISGFQMTDLGDAHQVFAYGIKYHRGEQIIAEIGQVRKQVLKHFDLKEAVFFADIHWSNVMKAQKGQRPQFTPLSRFPAVRRDLAFVVDESVNFGAIEQSAKKAGGAQLKEVNLFDVYRNTEQLGSDKKSYAVSFLFESDEATLQEKEIEALLTAIRKQVEQKVGAVVRG